MITRNGLGHPRCVIVQGLRLAPVDLPDNLLEHLLLLERSDVVRLKEEDPSSPLVTGAVTSGPAYPASRESALDSSPWPMLNGRYRRTTRENGGPECPPVSVQFSSTVATVSQIAPGEKKRQRCCGADGGLPRPPRRHNDLPAERWISVRFCSRWRHPARCNRQVAEGFGSLDKRAHFVLHDPALPGNRSDEARMLPHTSEAARRPDRARCARCPGHSWGRLGAHRCYHKCFLERSRFAPGRS